MENKFYSQTDKTTSTWLTPLDLINSLGSFKLDPCGLKDHKTAEIIYDIRDGQDGLVLPWIGRTFCNPPYSENRKCIWPKFAQKIAEHGDGIMLIPNRTETQAFFDFVWDKADAILFKKRRISFLTINGKKGSSTHGSVLIAYGENNVLALQNSKIEGKLILLK